MSQLYCRQPNISTIVHVNVIQGLFYSWTPLQLYNQHTAPQTSSQHKITENHFSKKPQKTTTAATVVNYLSIERHRVTVRASCIPSVAFKLFLIGRQLTNHSNVQFVDHHFASQSSLADWNNNTTANSAQRTQHCTLSK